jgi:hypothetical protein
MPADDLRSVDLNADLGEEVTDDAGLLRVVTSANVACGFHAGTPQIMRAVCAVAAERGIAVGAQVSYHDRENFGRVAHDVPSDVRPVPDEFDGDDLNIGFLLTAARNGKLNPSTMPIDTSITNEFRIRLGFAQRSSIEGVKLETCQVKQAPFDIEVDKGESVGLTRPFHAETIDEIGGEPTSPPVGFDNRNGRRFTAELPDLKLRITPDPPTPGADPFVTCEFDPS